MNKINIKNTVLNYKIFWGLICLTPVFFAFKSDVAQRTNKDLFEEIIFKYVDQFPEITNTCNAKPFYKIYFISSNDTIKFWIGGHIGRPSLVPPIEPGTKPPMNPKELKGILKVNKQPLVVYDYKNSDGYGLFNPKSVNKKRLKKLKEIDDYCAAGVLNPEAWLVAISNGKLLIIDKREPYRIQL